LVEGHKAGGIGRSGVSRKSGPTATGGCVLTFLPTLELGWCSLIRSLHRKKFPETQWSSHTGEGLCLPPGSGGSGQVTARHRLAFTVHR
jgi:hypothetical protein